MKNNKGQVLVLFLLLLPLIIITCAFIIDSSLMVYNKNKIDNINSDILSSISKKIDVTESDIRLLYNLNDEDIIIDEIKIDISNISVKTHKDIKPIFGKIIGLKKYTVISEKKIKYKSNISMYFEINNNIVNSLDGRSYNINNNQINLYNINISNNTLELTFTNLNNNIFTIGNNTLRVDNNHLYLNEIDLGKVSNKNIIDIVGNDKNDIYLNGKYISNTNNLEGNFIIYTSNIKYVKLYNSLLNNKNIVNNYNNRSWLDEE